MSKICVKYAMLGARQIEIRHKLSALVVYLTRQILASWLGWRHAPMHLAWVILETTLRQRLKLLGRARLHAADDRPDLVALSEPPGGHGAKPERLFQIEVVSYDWNCPKFITPRFTAEHVRGLVDPLKARIAELEEELAQRQS